MTTEIRPDLKALVNMAVSQLNAISEAIPDDDQLASIKIAKHAKQARGLIDMIRQEINNFRLSHKATPIVKKK